jgi:chemotaxis protein MotA
MGIIGAVMGLMAVMQNLADPSKLGSGIAAAFVSTIYGISLAYLFMLPMSAKLKSITRNRARLDELLVEGLISIAQGDNPRQIESKLKGFLP